MTEKEIKFKMNVTVNMSSRSSHAQNLVTIVVCLVQCTPSLCCGHAKADTEASFLTASTNRRYDFNRCFDNSDHKVIL